MTPAASIRVVVRVFGPTGKEAEQDADDEQHEGCPRHPTIVEVDPRQSNDRGDREQADLPLQERVVPTATIGQKGHGGRPSSAQESVDGADPGPAFSRKRRTPALHASVIRASAFTRAALSRPASKSSESSS